MPVGAGNKTPWSDAEKLSVLFQIIEAAGNIPWDTLEIPEGRTLKGMRNMIAKEKAKVGKEADAGGEVGEGKEKNTPKKRGAGKMDEEGSPTKKGKKTPAKKGGKGKADEDDEEAVMGNEEFVKAEPVEEDDCLAT